jgi:hypothetical protein
VRSYEEHGKQWKKLAEVITTRTVLQVRTHAQKYFNKLSRNAQKLGEAKSKCGQVKLKEANGSRSRKTKPKVAKLVASKVISRQAKTAASSEKLIVDSGSNASNNFKRQKLVSLDVPDDTSAFNLLTIQSSSRKKRKKAGDRVGEIHRKRHAGFHENDNILFLWDLDRKCGDSEADSFRFFGTHTTPPPRKYIPLVDIASPVAQTDMNSFRFFWKSHQKIYG